MRRLRNNLRIILNLTIKNELSRLRNLESLYLHKKRKLGLTPSQQKRFSQVKRRLRGLYFRYVKSTLQCGGGSACYSFQEAKKQGFNPQDRPTDLDLVWIPWLEKWFCIKCFVFDRLGEMTHEEFDDPVWREWVKSEFGI